MKISELKKRLERIERHEGGDISVRIFTERGYAHKPLSDMFLSKKKGEKPDLILMTSEVDER